MRTIENLPRFLKALEHVDEHYYSKPYGITPILDRWFNQLAMVQFEKSKEPLHITAQIALEFVDIILDGKVIPKKDIEAIINLYGQKSDIKKEFENIIDDIDKNILRLEEETKTTTADDEKALAKHKKELTNYKAQRSYHEKLFNLYSGISENGKSILNESALEREYRDKIKNIVYKPNHGLTHAARAARAVTEIEAFLEKHNKSEKKFKGDMEKLQYMMLFSVVGRKDETGFNDKSTTARKTYKSFRAASARAYLNYYEKDETTLYKDRNELYRDALLVELMGYNSLEQVFNNLETYTPEILIDFVIESEQKKSTTACTREQAIALLINKKYTIETLFPDKTLKERANYLMRRMNDAHGIELTRCYTLLPRTKGGSCSIKYFLHFLNSIDFFKFEKDLEMPTTSEKLSSLFNLFRHSFDLLKETGQNSMFGLISRETFDQKKPALLSAIQKIINEFDNASLEEKLKFIENAKVLNKSEKEGDFFSYQETTTDKDLLTLYRNHLILLEITGVLVSAEEKLSSSNAMFEFQTVLPSKKEEPRKHDHHKNVVALIEALESVKPSVTSLLPTKLPVISDVEYSKNYSAITLCFETHEDIKNFCETYESYFYEKLAPHEGMKIQVDKKKYAALSADRLIEFKEVKIPEKVDLEESFIDDNGDFSALNLIEDNKALGRLVSTSALSGESFPDYEYFFNALEDPIHDRYKVKVRERQETKGFKLNREVFFDPRLPQMTGLPRKISEKQVPLRFQEPRTKPRPYAHKVLGWTIGRKGPKNTVFTKKMAHSRIPTDGRMIPYAGYRQKQSIYFPIGLLSNRDLMDLQDERFSWKRNMYTTTRFWLRDPSIYSKEIYSDLHAKIEHGKVLFEKGVPTLDTNSLLSTKKLYLIQKDITEITDVFLEKMKNIYFRPGKVVVDHYLSLLSCIIQHYYYQLKDSDSDQHKFIDFLKEKGLYYFETNHSLIADDITKINKEKFAVKISEMEKKEPGDEETVKKHSEILACNTKSASQALYIVHDSLFYRLNMALHAKEIKNKYHYDLPLFILSQYKPPCYYSDLLFQADLREAYNLLQSGEFPYDTSTFPDYKLDINGELVFDREGNVLLNSDNPVQKNMHYQQETLLKLFKLGFQDLATLDDLSQGQINDKKITEKTLNESIAAISKKIAFLGSFERETTFVEKAMQKEQSIQKQQKLFLREIALGHSSLIKKMLENKSVVITEKTYQKALILAEKRGHVEIKALLSEKSHRHYLTSFVKNQHEFLTLLKKFPHSEWVVIFKEFNAYKLLENIFSDRSALLEILYSLEKNKRCTLIELVSTAGLIKQSEDDAGFKKALVKLVGPGIHKIEFTATPPVEEEKISLFESAKKGEAASLAKAVRSAFQKLDPTKNELVVSLIKSVAKGLFEGGHAQSREKIIRVLSSFPPELINNNILEWKLAFKEIRKSDSAKILTADILKAGQLSVVKHCYLGDALETFVTQKKAAEITKDCKAAWVNPLLRDYLVCCKSSGDFKKEADALFSELLILASRENIAEAQIAIGKILKETSVSKTLLPEDSKTHDPAYWFKKADTDKARKSSSTGLFSCKKSVSVREPIPGCQQHLRPKQ